jgi:hypothetical protein
VPKFDKHSNPLTREQRKALKKEILQAQAEVNPLKCKSPELSELNEVHAFDDISPSKRPHRDAVTFDAVSSSGDASGVADLSQLFSLEWASLPSSTETPQLPKTLRLPCRIQPAANLRTIRMVNIHQ